MTTIVSVEFIEFDMPYCALSYGVAPCTATLSGPSPTGSIKCFNTPKTCQDRAHYTDAPVSMRFCPQGEQYIRAGIEAFALVTDISFTPQVISLGETMGQRASLAVSFRNQLWTDTGPGFDKYLAERPYDPFNRGTFWGKFRARQISLRGRELRWYRGVEGQALEDMEKRTFIIDHMEGPNLQGEFQIIAKDALKFADGDRSQAPRLSLGFLTADINEAAGSFVLSPVGIGATYPANGYVAVGGKEIMAFTRSGDTMSVTRAQYNTPAEAHKAQDRVQLCLIYTGADMADIFADLLTNYAGVPSKYIPIDSWRAETASHLAQLYSRCIPEPTPVDKLAAELVKVGGLYVYWDDLAPAIRLRVIRPIATDVAVLSPDLITRKSLGNREQPDLRVSDVWVYYSQNNPLKKVDDADNYRSVVAVLDGEAAEDYFSPAVYKLYAPWIADLGRQSALRTGNIRLGRFRDPPRRLTCKLSRTGGIVPILGEGYRVEGLPFEDATGAPVQVPAQLVRLQPNPGDYALDLQEMLFRTFGDFDPSARNLIIDSARFNVKLRAAYNLLYPPPTSGTIVNCYVEAGARVGSLVSGTPALDIGSWPAGVIINLFLLGRLQGKGGDANTSGSTQPNIHGGTALKTTVPINIDFPVPTGGSGPSGEIFGGGGGGGFRYPTGGPFAGGGGGQGLTPGLGGPASYPGQPGTTEAAGAPGVGAGSGGTAGQPGVSGGGRQGRGSPGGSAGAAIDGISNVTFIGATGDIRGPQIN